MVRDILIYTQYALNTLIIRSIIRPNNQSLNCKSPPLDITSLLIQSLDFHRNRITIPLHRLVLEILFSLLKPLALIQADAKAEKHIVATLEATLTNITSLKEICVSASLVVYSAKAISSMLVSHSSLT